MLDATSRNLERKPEGSNPDSPDKQRARKEDDTPGWAKTLIQKVDDVGKKVDDITSKVDDAVKIAREAKDGVKLIDVKVGKFQGEIDNMKKDMEEWKSAADEKIAQNEFKEAAEESNADAGSVSDQWRKEIDKKIFDIQNKYIKPLMTDDDERTIVITGLGGEHEEGEATERFASQLNKLQPEQSSDVDIWFKGDTYKGVLFCKLDGSMSTTKAISELNKSKPKFQGAEVRFKKEAPVEERAPLSFLLGLRWQLGEWGENKKTIKVDENNMTLKFNRKLVACVKVKDDRLEVEWLTDEWKQWKEFHDSAEVKALVEAADKKLQQAAEGKHGVGKGKKGKGKGAEA
jgi:hypothetical protein